MFPRRSAPPRAFLRPLAMLALAGLAAGSPGVAAERTDERLQQLLEAIREDEQIPAAARQLAALGPDAVPDLIRALAAPDVTDAQEEALFAGLTRMDGRAALAPLRTFGREGSKDERVAAMRVCARLATEDDLWLLTSLASPPGDASFSHRNLQEAFRNALRLIWKRTGGPTASVVPVTRDSHPTVQRSIVHALGRIVSERSLEVLLDLLGRSAELDPHVLETAWRLARELPAADLDPDRMERVREYLTARDFELVIPAAHTVGALSDLQSAPILVGLLSTTEEPSAAVHRALQDITGQAFGPSTDLWTRWLDEQERWRDEHHAELLATLRGEDPAAVHRALIELGSRGMFRRATGRRLSEFLVNGPPAYRLTTCATLAQLRATTGIPGLVTLLGSPDRQTRRAAHRALLSITGLQLPEDASSWTDALSSKYPSLLRQ